MSISTIIRSSFAIVALCLLVPQNAQAGKGKCLDQTGCACFCCPACDHVCKLEAEEVEEEKTCFNVESKAICIPRVVFPWQKAKKASCASCDSCDGHGCTSCVHNGARVRKVCVLKTEKYKCPACKYTWTAEKRDTCGGCSGGPTCDGACVCDSEIEAGIIMLPPASNPVAMPIAPMQPTPLPALSTPVTPQPVAPHAGAAWAPNTRANDYYRVSGGAESKVKPLYRSLAE